MKATLIKKDDSYYLSTEKQTDLCYHLEHKEILKVKGVGENSGEVHHNKGWNKSDEVLFINTEVKLSIKNCDELFGVVDVEKYISEDSFDKIIYSNSYKQGFNKAMELNKDKVFTLDDMRNAIVHYHYLLYNDGKEGGDANDDRMNYVIQSLQQPTEIEVEIEMYDFELPGKPIGRRVIKPKLDSSGNLILKRVV